MNRICSYCNKEESAFLDPDTNRFYCSENHHFLFSGGIKDTDNAVSHPMMSILIFNDIIVGSSFKVKIDFKEIESKNALEYLKTIKTIGNTAIDFKPVVSFNYQIDTNHKYANLLSYIDFSHQTINHNPTPIYNDNNDRTYEEKKINDYIKNIDPISQTLVIKLIEDNNFEYTGLNDKYHDHIFQILSFGKRGTIYAIKLLYAYIYDITQMIMLNMTNIQRYVNIESYDIIDKTITEKMISISTPKFDEPCWSQECTIYRIEEKKLTNNKAAMYEFDQIKDKSKISFIVRDNDKHLIGYITCSLYKHDLDFIDNLTNLQCDELNVLRDEKMNKRTYNDAFFFNTFSIDGLYVSPSFRGGSHHSVATILIFYALSFIKRDAHLLLMIASNAVNKSTMLILKKYGFHFIDHKYALKWLLESIKSDTIWQQLDYYISENRKQLFLQDYDEIYQFIRYSIYPYDIKKNIPTEEEIKTLNSMVLFLKHIHKDNHDINLITNNVHDDTWGSYNTFLSIRKESGFSDLFLFEMNRIKAIIKGSEEELEIEKKRKRLTHYISYNTLNRLSYL